MLQIIGYLNKIYAVPFPFHKKCDMMIRVRKILSLEASFMNRFEFAARYVAHHWWQYVLGIAALNMVDWVNVYVPEFTGRIIDGLENSTLDMQGAMHFVWMIAGMGLAIAIGRFG